MVEIHSASIKSLMFVIGSLLLNSCSEDDDTHAQVSDAACLITSAPSYFGTTQTFEYDQSNYLTARNYPFGVAGYEPFMQTINSSTSFYTYKTSAAVIEVTDVFTGGTGNLYDGMPETMLRSEHQTYSDGRPDFNSGPKTLLTFQYDDKKRLSSVTYHHDLLTYDVYVTYSRQLYTTVLELTYDNDDNVTKLLQKLVFREGVYIPNKPSDSYFSYEEAVHTSINVTYDGNPSPYSAILKYWKFVQGDWGYVTNSNWNAIIMTLSKNNPLVVSYDTYQGKAVQISNSMAYNYNEQRFPIDGYTYKCR